MEIQGEFDCVVVGSGFGGSVLALRLAQAGRSVLVLERGRSYPPGEFPRSPLQASINFWDPQKNLYGLYDIWSFRHFDSVVSSGLGGGSLIYANVLLRKPENWFPKTGPGGESWPITRADLDSYYATVENELGRATIPNQVPKMRDFEAAAKKANMAWEPAPLAVSFSPPGQPFGLPVGVPADNLHGAARTTCRMCGQCDVGCNYGSKNTLDLTYLSKADAHPNAEIKTLHEVWGIAPIDGGANGYWVDCVRHQPPHPPWERDKEPVGTNVRYRAKTLVIAAGALGSTYLLLRNRMALPNLSHHLGTRFSGNGDYLGFFRGNPNNFAASDGPVITSYVQGPDALDGDPGATRGYVLQDGGYPALVEWIAETAGLPPLARVARVAAHLLKAHLFAARPRTEVSSALSAAIGSSRRSRGTLAMLGFGRDLPEGVMSLNGKDLEIAWNMTFSNPVFRPMEKAMGAIADGLGVRFHSGPSSMLSRMITVHPLGGCPMACTADGGVVDSHGGVFNYPNLFVMDGSVMPGPVGVNPSLTIAAVAERSADVIVGSAGR